MAREPQQRSPGIEQSVTNHETASAEVRSVETVTERVGFTDTDARKLSAVSKPEIRPSTLTEHSAESIPPEYRSELVSHLETLPEGPSAGRIRQTAALVESYTNAGHSPAEVIAPYTAVFDALLDRIFEDTPGEMTTEGAKSQLQAVLRATLVDFQAAIEAADSTAGEDNDTGSTSPNGGQFSVDQLLDTLPIPAFIVDTDHHVVGWNDGSSYLLQMDESEVLGEHTAESIKKGSASDKTLADKVIDAPYTAHEKYDIERIETPYTECLVYEDTGVATDMDDNEIHVEYKAMPMFENDELVGVFEIYQDRTETVQRRQALEGIVNEITSTLEAISAGDLSARCSFQDEHDVVEDELLSIVDEVNHMATEFQRLVERVDEKTGELTKSIQTAVQSAETIDAEIDEQISLVEEVAGEMESFSATMEEVAATADTVANDADRTRTAAENGLTAGNRARDTTDSVADLSQSLVTTVKKLDEHMNDIEEVVSVISDIAEQTNMLALNANIEAARAGEAGTGFAVVADEVKDLANETQSHTDEISHRIETIENIASQTVDDVNELHNNIGTAEAEIEETLSALEIIVESAESTADGIGEVAEANDEQAATVEEVTTKVDYIR